MPDADAGRPNFILIVTDQQRADYLGCYGHPVLETPHIDSIAQQGTAFDRFYVASPVCMPNRASLMTGRMPSVHGVRANGIPLSRNCVTFVDLLRAAGYATALVGKSHLQTFTGRPAITRRSPAPDGYFPPPAGLAQAMRHDLDDGWYGQESPDFWSGPNPRLAKPFYGFDHVELVTGHGDDVGGDYVAWLLARKPDARRLLGPNNALPHDYICPQAHRTAIPESLYSTAYIGERAAAYLAQAAVRTDPFFLTVSFPDPHHPFNPPGRYWGMYRPEQFPVPEAFLRNDWAPPPLVEAALAERARGEANLEGMRTLAVSAREAQEAQALTCGMISCIDDAVGRVLEACRQCGLVDDTVLIFTSDHGDHLGDHRLLLKGAEQYQSIVRVPFIWRDPGNRDAPRRTGALGSTIDIAATILDRARVAPFAGMQGRTLLPAMRAAGDTARASVFIQYEHQGTNPATGAPPRIHTLVTSRWRLSIVQGAAWAALYDLQTDPGEFDNLWDSPAHAGIRAELVELLLRAEIEHADSVPLPTALA